MMAANEPSLYERIQETSAFLRARVSAQPRFGLILGTGLGALASQIQDAVAISYRDIPNFAHSTAESHAGNLVFGSLGGVPVVAMQGRVHFYEGYSMQQVTFPIRVMKALGVDSLVVTNAAGGMNPQMGPGDLVAIHDHINLMGGNPLIGPNDERLGDRFPDLSEPYDRAYLRRIEEIALEQRIRLHRGVFVAVAGPNLETAAEYRFLRWIGADVVGMSLIPETIVAVHGGQRVMSFNIVTDTCIPENLKPVSIPEILKVAGSVAPVLLRLVTEVVRRLSEVTENRLSPAENR
jgi:purine-nucleoside phosphorylase